MKYVSALTYCDERRVDEQIMSKTGKKLEEYVFAAQNIAYLFWFPVEQWNINKSGTRASTLCFYRFIMFNLMKTNRGHISHQLKSSNLYFNPFYVKLNVLFFKLAYHGS